MNEEQAAEYRRLVTQADALKAEARMLIQQGRFEDVIHVVDRARIVIRNSYIKVPGMLETFIGLREQCLTTLAAINLVEKAHRDAAAEAAERARRGR